MTSWMEVLGQWKQGIAYPRWAALAHWGYGEARFLFYPPASWTLGAALGAALPWKMVPGAYCWIALTLAGASAYRLAREWLPVPDALFAAVFYALNPYHLLIVYWRSAFAELLAAALLPLLLLFVLRLNESVLNESGFRPALWLSLILAAAWLTNAPAAVMIHYSAAGLALIVVAIGAARPAAWDRSWNPQMWRSPVRMLARTALAMLLGAGLASFYLLPAIYEQRWINLSQVLSPGVRPQDNFLFTTLADPDHNHFNLLISTLALGEIGILACAICLAPRWRGHSDRRAWMLLSAWGTSSAVLMLALSNWLWQNLPELRFVQLPFRWLLCMNAALAMLLPIAAKRWTIRLLASAILLTVVIVAGHHFQPPWWEDASDVGEMSAALADGTGYEGSDEYVPAGADPYELNKYLPRLSDAAGAPVQSQMLAWGPTEKHFTVYASAPQNLVVRLFSYPAWEVVVNGKPIVTQKTEVTGVIVIPIGAGDNDVNIHFRRTTDRVAGNVISVISLAVFVVIWIRTRASKTLPSNPASSAA